MVIAFLYSTANDAFFRVKVLLASVLPSIISYGAPGPTPSGYLDITDSRTNRKYKIPIHRNSVEAIKFKEIRAPRDYRHPADMSERGLRLLDEGFQNTAVLASQITFVDGIEGRLRCRDLLGWEPRELGSLSLEYPDQYSNCRPSSPNLMS